MQQDFRSHVRHIHPCRCRVHAANPVAAAGVRKLRVSTLTPGLLRAMLNAAAARTTDSSTAAAVTAGSAGNTDAGTITLLNTLILGIETIVRPN